MYNRTLAERKQAYDESEKRYLYRH
ncbi:MAG: hypothetical protein JXA38_02580 [Methanosarcinaceae archaeon]|nr:hypothetical protein [Methanosarcinaceae archaeon]